MFSFLLEARIAFQQEIYLGGDKVIDRFLDTGSVHPRSAGGSKETE